VHDILEIPFFEDQG